MGLLLPILAGLGTLGVVLCAARAFGLFLLRRVIPESLYPNTLFDSPTATGLVVSMGLSLIGAGVFLIGKLILGLLVLV